MYKTLKYANKLKQRNVKINFFVCNVTAESKTFRARGAIVSFLLQGLTLTIKPDKTIYNLLVAFTKRS